MEHGIPGEQVEALVFGKRRKWAKITHVIDPSPDRVEAPCPHFHEGCGGCQWQMLSYESQVRRKIASLEAQLSASDLNGTLGEVHVMRNPWRYRVTAGLSLGHSCGFRRRGTQSIVALQDCSISHQLIGELAAYLNRGIQTGEIPNYSGQVSVEVRVVDDGQGVHTAIVPSPGSRYASIEAVAPVTRYLATFHATVGVLYRHKQDAPLLLHGAPFGTQILCDKPFAVSAATFFQTNLSLLPRLIQCILSTEFSSKDLVIDIYGGVGVFGLLLASRVGRVVEIEIDPVGIEAAQQSAGQQGANNVDFIAGTAEAVLDGITQADAVIVDPPRSGLTPKVVDAIGRLRPSRILYVSCFGGTLIRDMSSFQSFGYHNNPINVFDFYPQTRHLELFTLLERE